MSMLPKENPGKDQKMDSLESVAKRMHINVDWQDNSDSFEWKQIELQKFSMQSILNLLVQYIQWKIILLRGNLEKDRGLMLREILTCLFNRTILVRTIWLC